MKKLLTLFLTFVLLLSACTLFACNDNGEINGPNGDQGVKLELYCPDGAPALSVARLMHDNTIIESINFNVVEANLIASKVTGENPSADIAIMPVNAASKLLGSKNDYKLVGTVTHGNLFLMKKQTGENITLDNISTLIGKKVGVINLANVPGLTFKAILNDNSLPFITLGDGVSYDATKVNLVGLTDGKEVTPAAECDYFVVPEPAATTKQNATGGKLSISASLQDLYGQGQGYPQAVLVAKTSVLTDHADIVNALVSSFAQNKAWLQTASANNVLSAISSHYEKQDTAPAFTANNLNATVIQNCAINFVSAQNSKVEILTYLQKINAVSNNAWGTPNDNFFYIGA